MGFATDTTHQLQCVDCIQDCNENSSPEKSPIQLTHYSVENIREHLFFSWVNKNGSQFPIQIIPKYSYHEWTSKIINFSCTYISVFSLQYSFQSVPKLINIYSKHTFQSVPKLINIYSKHKKSICNDHFDFKQSYNSLRFSLTLNQYGNHTTFDDQSELIKHELISQILYTISSPQTHYLRRHMKILLKVDRKWNEAALKYK